MDRKDIEELIPELNDEKKKFEAPPNLFKQTRKVGIRKKSIVIALAAASGALLFFAFVDMRFAVSGTARVIPGKFSIVEAIEPGVIEQLQFASGSKVRQGDLICRLRNEQLSEESEAADFKVSMLEQKALMLDYKIKYNKGMVERSEELYKEDVIALAELEKLKLEHDTARKEYEMNGFELESARNKAAMLKRSLANLEIRAPMPGVMITKIEDKPGTYAAKGQVICEIAYLNSVILEFPVKEPVLRNISVGDSVTVRFNVDSGRPLKGRVVKIHHVAWERLEKVLVKENVINVLIETEDIPFELRPGMTAQVRIHSGKIGIRGL